MREIAEVRLVHVPKPLRASRRANPILGPATVITAENVRVGLRKLAPQVFAAHALLKADCRKGFGSTRGSADSVTGFDDACLVANLVSVPVADDHFDVGRHSLCVRSPLRRQRHLLRFRERLGVPVIHLVSPCPYPEGYSRLKRGLEVIPCGETPSASVGRAGGPGNASGYAVQRPVTPRHMITGLVFASIFIRNYGYDASKPRPRQLFDFH
jgi:hypothetical protein